MKTILSLVLSLLLCVQTVYAMPAGNKIVYEETKEDVTARPEETAEETQQTAKKETAGEESRTDISAPSAILMEASTGQIIFDKNAEEQLPPASVTKVMTLLLIFDALDAGKLSLADEVSVSEYAASMGGSQVFLEPGEVQTVDTMIKCIAVASANDACVAMAEKIAGNEGEFVNQMNTRAAGLGMTHTHFENCNGLDADGHLTTAHDIALMSRELIVKYPEIHNYSTIWMENITHKTKKGTTEFGLTNTNKLIRQYEYATGLKTGSTSKAKYCVSATAKKDDMELIAVIMAAPDYKVRFQDAETLLNYGFGKCTKYEDDKIGAVGKIPVVHGVEEEVTVETTVPFHYIDVSGADLSAVEKKLKVPESLEAPVKAGTKVGVVSYVLNEKEIGAVPVTAKTDIEKMNMKSAFLEALRKLSM